MTFAITGPDVLEFLAVEAGIAAYLALGWAVCAWAGNYDKLHNAYRRLER